jgi:AraC-like DNA-binding protein
VEADQKQSDLVLGQASSTYSRRHVVFALREHFVCQWRYHVTPGLEKKTAVMPDGCADLMWENGRLWVSGPDRDPSFPAIAPGTTLVGFRFQPGAAAAWLGLPAAEIVGAHVPLGCIRTNESRRLLDSLGDTRDAEIVSSRFEKALAAMSADIHPPDRYCGEIFRLLGTAGWVNKHITRELVRLLGPSERTLRRRCDEAFGYGPKTLDRILRMQRFLEFARKHHTAGLAYLAGSVGYADQAHLSREARRLTGLTAKEILEQLARAKDEPTGPMITDR